MLISTSCEAVTSPQHNTPKLGSRSQRRGGGGGGGFVIVMLLPVTCFFVPKLTLEIIA